MIVFGAESGEFLPVLIPSLISKALGPAASEELTLVAISHSAKISDKEARLQVPTVDCNHQQAFFYYLGGGAICVCPAAHVHAENWHMRKWCGRCPVANLLIAVENGDRRLKG